MSVSCGIIETTVLIFGNILPFSSMWSIFCQLLFNFCASLFSHLILSLVFVLCINLITSKRPVISAKLIWIQESLHVCLPRVLLNKVKKSCMAWQVQQINTASVETNNMHWLWIICIQDHLFNILYFILRRPTTKLQIWRKKALLIALTWSGEYKKSIYWKSTSCLIWQRKHF